MTDKEVLQKAIEVAIENGYELPDALNMNRQFWIDRFSWFKIYFSHDFAKAFWGMDSVDFKDGVYVCADPSCGITDKLWSYHLQQMIVRESPISYLKEFLDNAETSKNI